MTLHNPAQLDSSLVGPHHKLLSTEDLSKPLPEGAEYWDDTHRRWETVYRTGIEKPHKFFTYRIPLTRSDRLKAERDQLVKSKRRVHELKTWPEFYEPVSKDIKTFEIRDNDRDFKVGDVLYLREFNPQACYTGRTCYKEVTYLTDWGQKPNQVVLGIRPTGPCVSNQAIDREIAKLDEQIRVVEAVEKGARYEHDCGRGEWFEPPPSCQKPEQAEHFFKGGYQVRLKPTPQSIPWTLESHPDVVTVKHKDQIMEDEFLIIRWRKDFAYLDGPGWVYYADLHRDWLQRNGSPAGQEVEG